MLTLLQLAVSTQIHGKDDVALIQVGLQPHKEHVALPGDLTLVLKEMRDELMANITGFSSKPRQLQRLSTMLQVASKDTDKLDLDSIMPGFQLELKCPFTSSLSATVALTFPVCLRKDGCESNKGKDEPKEPKNAWMVCLRGSLGLNGKHVNDHKHDHQPDTVEGKTLEKVLEEMEGKNLGDLWKTHTMELKTLLEYGKWKKADVVDINFGLAFPVADKHVIANKTTTDGLNMRKFLSSSFDPSFRFRTGLWSVGASGVETLILAILGHFKLLDYPEHNEAFKFPSLFLTNGAGKCWPIP